MSAILAGEAGFEPAINRVRAGRLTTWLLPIEMRMRWGMRGSNIPHRESGQTGP